MNNQEIDFEYQIFYFMYSVEKSSKEIILIELIYVIREVFKFLGRKKDLIEIYKNPP